MAHQHRTNSLHSLHAFSVKALCRVSPTSPNMKATVQAYILRRVCHVVRAVACAKTMAMEFFNNKKRDSTSGSYRIKLRGKKKKKVLSSIKLCFTCPSSYVIPVSEPHSMEGIDTAHEYYDSSWNSIVLTEERIEDAEPPLSGYLRWLEEKDRDGAMITDDDDGGIVDIDRLAEKFIENCHEKFRLEKQESYRRYQEMLARSM